MNTLQLSISAADWDRIQARNLAFEESFGFRTDEAIAEDASEIFQEPDAAPVVDFSIDFVSVDQALYV